MFETTMVLVAERAADMERARGGGWGATAADPLLARVTRFARGRCSGASTTSTRAAPVTGRRHDYQRVA